MVNQSWIHIWADGPVAGHYVSLPGAISEVWNTRSVQMAWKNSLPQGIQRYATGATYVILNLLGAHLKSKNKQGKSGAALYII